MFTTSHADWGAIPVSSTDRTNQTWESNFTNATVVRVGLNRSNKSVQSGINDCPSNDFCHIKLDGDVFLDANISSAAYVFINRSNLKISGSRNANGTIESILKSGEDTKAFMYFGSNVQNIIVEDIRFQGKQLLASTIDNSPRYGKAGITAYGSGIKNVTIRNNKFDNFKVPIEEVDLLKDQNGYAYNFKYGAHAISFGGTGTSEDAALSNILIENNIVHDMDNGHSESISVGGNIKNWEIINNTIFNVTKCL